MTQGTILVLYLSFAATCTGVQCNKVQINKHSPFTYLILLFYHTFKLNNTSIQSKLLLLQRIVSVTSLVWGLKLLDLTITRKKNMISAHTFCLKLLFAKWSRRQCDKLVGLLDLKFAFSFCVVLYGFALCHAISFSKYSYIIGLTIAPYWFTKTTKFHM